MCPCIVVWACNRLYILVCPCYSWVYFYICVFEHGSENKNARENLSEDSRGGTFYLSSRTNCKLTKWLEKEKNEI